MTAKKSLQVNIMNRRCSDEVAGKVNFPQHSQLTGMGFLLSPQEFHPTSCRPVWLVPTVIGERSVYNRKEGI